MWRHADLDWAAWLDELEAWRPLSIFARRTILDQLRPDEPVIGARLSGHLDSLKAHGWIPPPGRGTRHVPPGRRPLLTTLRAFDRARLFERCDHAAMLDYLRTHTDTEPLAHGLGRPGTTLDVLAHVVVDDGGLDAFLDHGDPSDWATTRWPRTDLARRLGETGEAVRSLVDWLCNRRDPVALGARRVRELPLDDATLARALAVALPSMLCFVSLRARDLEPVLGCWPPAITRIRRRRTRRAPHPLTIPPPADGATGEHAGLIDLTNLVAACVAEPPRVKSTTFELFKRARQELARRLTPVPTWLEGLMESTPEGRVDALTSLATRLGYLAHSGDAGKSLCLEPTAEGRRWLAGDDATRLRAVIDVLREIRAVVAQRDHGHRRHPFNGYLRFVPPVLHRFLADEDTRTRHVVDAFASLPVDTFYPLETFLDHQSVHHNPLATWRTGVPHSWPESDRDTETLERLWAQQLRRFFVERLLWLGGARVTRTADDEVVFALTGVGRYLLGLSETFDLAGGESARLIVQPSFEIVFLAPAPLAEGRLARFAERIGDGHVGVLFRLTREAAQHAAAAGLEADEALASLRDAAQTEVPDNVARQLQEWFDGCRRIEVAETVIIRCPDEATAARVLATGAGQVRPLSPTIVELVDPSKQSNVLRRLRGQGVFPATGPVSPADEG